MSERVRGTTPEGTASEVEAARYVRDMFGRVAPRYDLLNRLLSFNIDQGWRRHTTRRLREVLERPQSRVLDLCCGTGDLLKMLRDESRGQVIGVDFAHQMLVRSKEKTSRVGLAEADGLRLPFADASFDAITIAFGFRNFANYAEGLREMRRVTKPGGCVAILEFSHPPSALVRAGNEIYCQRILPWLGGLVSGASDAYRYLPSSVKKFPGAEELRDDMVAAGFASTSFERLTLGVVALHIGQVS